MVSCIYFINCIISKIINMEEYDNIYNESYFLYRIFTFIDSDVY